MGHESNNTALYVFILLMVVGLGVVVFIPPRSGVVSDSSVNDTTFDPYAAHAVQQIDGCEYILYQVKPLWGERRMIHKVNCQNHSQ